MTVETVRRLDVWLWYARFFKTRSLATRVCERRRIRINGDVVRKASRLVRIGDVITLAHRGQVRVIRILDLGERRGPASEAAGLYDDMSAGEDAAPDTAS